MIYWRADNLEIDTSHFCHVDDQPWKPSIFILINQIPRIGVGVDRKMGSCGVLLIKIVKGALYAKIVNFCYPCKLSDMIDALIKRVSVNYKCYEMYAHRGKKVQLLVF